MSMDDFLRQFYDDDDVFLDPFVSIIVICHNKHSYNLPFLHY